MKTAPGPSHLAAFASGDAHQALVYLLRRDVIAADGRLRTDAPPLRPLVRVPGLAAGRYRVCAWDTTAGAPVASWTADAAADALTLEAPPLATDLMLAITPAGEGQLPPRG